MDRCIKGGSYMKFLPRKDPWLSVTIWSCIIALAVLGLSPFFVDGAGFIGGLIILLFCFACAGFIAWLWIYTFYELKETELIIQYGPFTKLVPFNDIRTVNPIHSWAASAATSYKRVEIKYGNYDFVHVSPLNQETFLQELKQRCPEANIEISK